MTSKSDLSKEPMYNIRSVVERTGIAAETIRAWERRYGFPEPYRSPNGYRLYTEDEIAALKWLKGQTASGMSIGQSINLLLALRARGQGPVETDHASAEGCDALISTPPVMGRGAPVVSGKVMGRFSTERTAM